MALLPCPECTREVSDSAAQCPHCGYPLRGTRGLWVREANHADTMFACVILGFATAYLILYGVGLANARNGNPAALLILGLPVLPVLLVGLLFRIYRTAAISALITIALFLVMVLGFVGPFLFGEHAQSGDGAGLGLGTGLVFVWQWGIVLVFLVVVAIGSVIERKAIFSREQRRRQPLQTEFQTEPPHAPEPVGGSVSSGESSPPAR